MTGLEDETARCHLMVLEVLSDSGEVDKGLNTKAVEDILVANSREFQQLRSIEDTSREDDFLGGLDGICGTIVAEGDTGCRVYITLLSKVDLGSLCSSQDHKVGFTSIGCVVGWGSIRARLAGWVDSTSRVIDADIVAKVL
jgi:hypothetical protein